MMALGVGMLVLAYLLLYSAFQNHSPLAEISAVLGKHG